MLNKGSNINRCGSRTSAAMTASDNKAERRAIAETLEAKVASMGKMSVTQGQPPKGKGKSGKGKGKKDDRIVGASSLVFRCSNIVLRSNRTLL